MTTHRHQIPISRKLFSFLELQEKVGELPCQNFPDAFFPDIGSTGHQDTQYAKELCSMCPIMNECRTYAIEAKEPLGIWGGLTAGERKTYRSTSSARYPSPSE